MTPVTPDQDDRPIAVLIPVGPGATERDRLPDLIESISHYETRRRVEILIVEDVSPSRNCALGIRGGPNVFITEIPNPRRGGGCGWSGGLAVGVTHGLHWLARNRDPAFVLRLDTDSLVIAPFTDQILHAFAKRPGVGMIGTHRTSARGSSRDPQLNRTLSNRQRKLLRPVATWFRELKLRGLQLSMFGHWRLLRETLESAMANGYELGEFVQGGGYAIHRTALRAMDSRGLLDVPRRWIRAPFSEDVAVSVCIMAAGHKLGGAVDDGEPFAVESEGLSDTPERLIQRGFSVIHALKKDRRFSEADIRAYFRAKRLSDYHSS